VEYVTEQRTGRETRFKQVRKHGNRQQAFEIVDESRGARLLPTGNAKASHRREGLLGTRVNRWSAALYSAKIPCIHSTSAGGCELINCCCHCSSVKRKKSSVMTS
jgi:hypothetical protein